MGKRKGNGRKDKEKEEKAEQAWLLWEKNRSWEKSWTAQKTSAPIFSYPRTKELQIWTRLGRQHFESTVEAFDFFIYLIIFLHKKKKKLYFFLSLLCVFILKKFPTLSIPCACDFYTYFASIKFLNCSKLFSVSL